jgi:uroporphyrinogen-III synthase
MFVSGGAVGQFMVQRPAGAAWPSAVWAAATGPGTAAALRSAGVPQAALVQPRADAPSLDSEALWAELQSHDWAGRRVLLVRGVGGRDWLQRQWQAAGAEVAAVEAYRRVPAPWSHAEQARAQAAWSAPEEHAWLFSSAQALAVLMSSTSTGAPGSGGLGLPAQGSMPRAAIATHPRIAAAAQAAGFQPLLVAKPTVGAVAQALREPTLHEPTLREPTLHRPEARSLQSRAS